MLWDAIEALVSAIDQRAGTPMHSVNVARITLRVAPGCCPHSPTDELRLGALLHDVGKVVFSDAFIENSVIDQQEVRDMVAAHTTAGVSFLSAWPALRVAVPYVLHHQEWIDGNGYPEGVAGDAIPVNVQVVSLADVYEALTFAREYRGRPALTREAALAQMSLLAGRRWRLDLFQVFAQLV